MMSRINLAQAALDLYKKVAELDALKTGETAERIALLNAWRETEYYDQSERAALSLMEAITLIAEGQVPDTVYEDALPFLTDDQIAAVEWLAIVINAWNRIAISSRYSVKP